MTDIRGARITRLLDDPQLGGDLLLVGMALAAKYDFGWDYGAGMYSMSTRLWPNHKRYWFIEQVFRGDMRTYRPPSPIARSCTSPMIRRDDECGRNATAWGHLTDWVTGECSYVGACRRHYAWYQTITDANRAAKPDVIPLPYANHGGVLAGHFPRLDWVTFWRKLEPRWVEHPERKPWPKPDLTLVLGNGGIGPHAVPLLSIVPSGGAW